MGKAYKEYQASAQKVEKEKRYHEMKNKYKNSSGKFKTFGQYPYQGYWTDPRPNPYMRKGKSAGQKGGSKGSSKGKNFYNYMRTKPADPSQFPGTKVKRTSSGNIYRPDYGYAVMKGLQGSGRDLLGLFEGGVVRGYTGKGIANLPRGELLKKIPSFKRGGKVRKTGLALVHKGERVIPNKSFSNKLKSKAKSQKRSMGGIRSSGRKVKSDGIRKPKHKAPAKIVISDNKRTSAGDVSGIVDYLRTKDLKKLKNRKY